MEASVAREWLWWAGALRNPSEIGSQVLPLHEGELHLGYYRKRSSKGADAVWQAVGVYPGADGIVRVRVDGRVVDEDRGFDAFSRACRQPIPFEIYYLVVVQKKAWPDAPPALTGAIEKGGDAPERADDAARRLPDARPETTPAAAEEKSARAPAAGVTTRMETHQGSGTSFPIKDFVSDAERTVRLPAATLGVPFAGTIKNVGHEPLNVDGKPLLPGHEITVPAADRAVSRSDNLPPDMDPLEFHGYQLAEEKALVEKFLETPIKTQTDADKASEWANRVSRLEKWFKDTHKALKAPLLEQTRALDAAYLRKAEDAAALAKKLTQHQTPFLVAEQKRLEAEAAAKQRIVEEEARRQAEASPPAGQQPVVAADPAPAPVKARSGGASGRATSLQQQRVAVIVDYQALASFLIHGGRQGVPLNSCANADLKEALDKAAHRIAQVSPIGSTQPGFEIVERPVARR